MDALVIKYVDNEYLVKCKTGQFKSFLYELENKLKNQFFKRDAFAAYFSFPFSLSTKQLYDLYILCDLYQVNILGFKSNIKYEQLKYLDHCFYNGESYELHETVIYVGDIEKDVEIISNSNLYVLGCVKGKIDLLYPHLYVSATTFQNAKIRIFDTLFQITTKNTSGKVYYDNNEMKFI